MITRRFAISMGFLAILCSPSWSQAPAVLSGASPIVVNSSPVETTVSALSVEGNASKVMQPEGGCKVERIEHDSSKAGDLFLTCGSRGTWVGSSITFSWAYNPTLGRYLVINRMADGDHVLLIRPSGESAPMLVENMTADLAAAALNGKPGQDRALGGGIDISAFATQGVIKLTSAASGQPLNRSAAVAEVLLVDDSHVVRLQRVQQMSATSGR